MNFQKLKMVNYSGKSLISFGASLSAFESKSKVNFLRVKVSLLTLGQSSKSWGSDTVSREYREMLVSSSVHLLGKTLDRNF